VPVIRVFGSTPRGQHCCLHIHSAFRHLLVPAPDPLARASADEVRSYLRDVAHEIDSALDARMAQRAAVAAAAAPGGMPSGMPVPAGGNSLSSAPRAWVFDIKVEMLTPFYGFHAEPRPFLKIW
jgi:hypothetical protein